MNVYANSPQGLYWLKSSGITGVKDLAGKKIGNPAGDGARTMWPALAKKVGIDPGSVTWVNIDANAKLSALKAKTIDATTSFFKSTTSSRASSATTWALAWKDAGVNPYGNSIIANGAWLKANRVRPKVREDHAEGIRGLRQDAGPLRPGAGRGQRRAASTTTSSTTGTWSPS